MKQRLGRFWYGLLALMAAGVVNAAVLPVTDNLYIGQTADQINQIFWEYQPEYQAWLNPVIFTAQGASSTVDLIQYADQVDQWRFVSAFVAIAQSKTQNKDNAKAAKAPLTLETYFQRGAFRVPLKVDDPWVGAEFTSITQVDMTLAEALRLVRAAGYPDYFLYTTLFKPLTPNIREFLYHFEMLQYRVFVGTRSHIVFAEPITAGARQQQSVLPKTAENFPKALKK